MIHVCSLAALPETVRLTGASHVLTVMAKVEQVQRPDSVLPANHLKVAMDDITEPMDGYVTPSEAHIAQVLDFVRGWDRGAPLARDRLAPVVQMAIARQIRSASPIASPNRLIVSLADKALGRDGRMLRALDDIGPASMMVEGKPFRIDLD